MLFLKMRLHKSEISPLERRGTFQTNTSEFLFHLQRVKKKGSQPVWGLLYGNYRNGTYSHV